MKSRDIRKSALGLSALAAIALATPLAGAGIIISEVHPSGSGNAPYQADFFELTNTGTSAVDITNWKMDDNSNAFASAVLLRGVSSIAPGQTVIFAEGNAAGTNDATIAEAFKLAWFGSNVPSGFTMGGYGGSGVGLSTDGDAVNIFDSTGARVTGIAFGASVTGFTFDNAAGLGSTTLPLPTVTSLSVAGVNGAFVSPAAETGSPGAVPEPSGIATLSVAALMATRRRRR